MLKSFRVTFRIWLAKSGFPLPFLTTVEDKNTYLKKIALLVASEFPDDLKQTGNDDRTNQTRANAID